MNSDYLPANLTPEERAHIETAKKRALAEIYRKRSIQEAMAEALNPRPALPEASDCLSPEGELSPAEDRLRAAIDWISLRLAVLRYQSLQGNKDAALLRYAVERLCMTNGLFLEPSEPAHAPEQVKRARGRPLSPEIRRQHYMESVRIHAELVRRIPLAIPHDPPDGDELGTLLDGYEQRIDQARQAGGKVLTQCVAAVLKTSREPVRPTRHYKGWRRWFLVQDLATALVAGFLARGGMAGIPQGHRLHLPSFVWSSRKR